MLAILRRLYRCLVDSHRRFGITSRYDFELERIGRSETPVSTSLRRTTKHSSEGLIWTATQAWNDTQFQFVHYI